MSEEAASALLYHSPYVRVAGTVCEGRRPPPLEYPPTLAETSRPMPRQSPFTAPPPSAVRLPPTLSNSTTSIARVLLLLTPATPHAQVTTHSFAELLKSKTRPQRYGPAEIFSQPVTEAQVAGFMVAQGKGYGSTASLGGSKH